jgi:ornithine carbamoyltransferase
MSDITKAIAQLSKLRTDMHGKDFLLTWEKSDAEIRALALVAEVLSELHRAGRPLRVFDSGLAISIFRDNSTRTRFSFASAVNALGLGLSDLDEEKSQIAHGETVRETANMISFMAEVIGIRDDMYLGEGNRYMRGVAAAVQEGFEQGVLHQRPTLVNLQCDIDHPTQSMADLVALKRHFGSLEALRGKKIAMSWAYSPSYGKPLSVPQGVIALMSRFGMDVTLANPEGYGLIPEVVELARRNSAASGGTFSVASSMEDAAPSEGRPRGPGGAREGVPGQQRALQVLGVRRGQDGAHPRRQGALHALPAGGHLRRQLRAGRGRGERLRALPAGDLPRGELQALRHRRHDPHGALQGHPIRAPAPSKGLTWPRSSRASTRRSCAGRPRAAARAAS